MWKNSLKRIFISLAEANKFLLLVECFLSTICTRKRLEGITSVHSFHLLLSQFSSSLFMKTRLKIDVESATNVNNRFCYKFSKVYMFVKWDTCMDAWSFVQHSLGIYWKHVPSIVSARHAVKNTTEWQAAHIKHSSTVLLCLNNGWHLFRVLRIVKTALFAKRNVTIFNFYVYYLLFLRILIPTLHMFSRKKKVETLIYIHTTNIGYTVHL